MNDVYIVKRGDTLYGISNQFGVSVTELAELNNVTAATLQVGQSLKIPSKSGINPDNMFMYTVKKGDSLYSIAKKYATSVEAIKKLNYLTSNNLYIGQVLRIPENYNDPTQLYIPNYINYTVVKGDNLYKIAQKYGVFVDTIIQDNALKNNVLKIGQVLKIRTSEDSLVEECFGEEYVPNNNTFSNYSVKRGDTLYSIARLYNTTVDYLIRLNNLTSNSLNIGQILRVPVMNNDVLYTVVRGDSLYSIARMFNTTVDNIKKKNGLIGNTLSIGQVLKI